MSSQIKIKRIDDGKDDLTYGFNINGRYVKFVTVHSEFFDLAQVDKSKRPDIGQGVAQLILGIIKPFIDLAGGGLKNE